VRKKAEFGFAQNLFFTSKIEQVDKVRAE